MKFTLLVATLNRPRELRKCLEHLLAQTYPDYEIIIVDQSDPERTDASVAEMSPRIRYLHIDQRGLSHARNVGLRYAEGDYICLVDDDGLYEADVLERAAEVIAAEAPVILGGKLMDPATGRYIESGPSRRVTWGNALRGFSSAVMMIDRSFLLAHPFDERFGLGAEFGACEESDLVLAALREAKKVWYTDRYTVLHTLVSIEQTAPAKLRQYSHAFGALYRKTIRHYSRFWGSWYFIQSFFGNLIVGACFFRRELGRKRLMKAQSIWRGFRAYSE